MITNWVLLTHLKGRRLISINMKVELKGFGEVKHTVTMFIGGKHHLSENFNQHS